MNQIRRTVLTIPAARVAPRERLLTVRPWFLRSPGEAIETAAPAILIFTTPDFVQEFLHGVAAHTGSYDANVFEPLIRYRDYAEPPGGMLDVNGDPRYPVPPAIDAVRRDPPGPQNLKQYTPTGADVLDGDGVPAGSPAWFRKLYLPLHQHFHIVSTELVCRHLGQFLKVRRARIIEVGIIVRRLVADPAQQRWEDWIPGPEGSGLWLEIADRNMRPLASGAGGAGTIDPAAIAAVLGTNAELTLRNRFGLAAGDALPQTLSVDRLSLIPSSIGNAAEHSAFFGYLPVQSSELEAPEIRLDVADLAALGAELASRARRHLRAQLLGDGPDSSATPADITQHVDRLRDRIRVPLGDLANRLILPAPPAQVEIDDSREIIRQAASPPFQDGAIDQAIQTILLRTLCAKPNADSAVSVADWWTNPIVQQALNSPIIDDQGPLGTALAANRSHADVLMRAEIHRIAALFAPGANTTPPSGVQTDTTVHQVLGVLLLRLRAFRKALAQELYDQIFQAPESPDLDEKRPDANGTPVVTVGSLADELSALLVANDQEERERAPRDWPPVSPPQAWVDVHRQGVALETALREVDARGSGAGGAYTQELVARAERVGAALVGTALAPDTTGISGTAQLRQRGLDLYGQPELGLLVHPTFAPTEANLMNFIDGVAAQYAPPPAGAAARIASEAEAIRNMVRPRFDAESLYAVWCFVRVGGRNPCELEQVIWTPRSDVFSLAEPTDILGVRPVPIRLPDLNKLVRDIPRIARAEARPYAAFTTPPDSGVTTGAELQDTRRQWGIARICSFGIPVFTICAWVMFSIIFAILSLIPGFAWMLLLRFCIPLPQRR